MYENQLGFFEEERELKFLWCVSDEYDHLQEQKRDRDCDEWENGTLTGSILAIIEEESALDPKLDNNKIWPGSPFCVFFYGHWTRCKERSTGSIECWKYFNQVCQNHP